ncbi:MAG TPA: hypothetical protein VFU23_12800 [Gemmatimonadales bacterium]|nr:hypothetical protein [Gemmatimonadales bacterium]
MIAVSRSPHVTAEWQCTKCGTTNRKFVPAGTPRVVDQCVTCHTRHEVTPGTRPVRWKASAL